MKLNVLAPAKYSQLFAASQASIQSLYTSAGSDRSKREREDIKFAMVPQHYNKIK